MTCSSIAQPIGPYSFGKIIEQPGLGTWGYSSGQIPLHPTTGEIVGTTASEQANRALTNLELLASANGFTMQDHTIKTTVFLTDMADFP